MQTDQPELIASLQVLMQVPSNMLLNWCGRPSWFLGFWTIAWGLVSSLTSQVDTYGEIVACRFVLGFVEAPFLPGVSIFMVPIPLLSSRRMLRLWCIYAGVVLPLQVVYEEGAQPTHVYLFLGLFDLGRIRKLDRCWHPKWA